MMKKYCIFSMLFLVLLFFGIALGPMLIVSDMPMPTLTAPISMSQLKQNQEKAMHTISITSSESKVQCTAYAIAPHVLLTVDHCLCPDSRVYIDQKILKHPSVYSEVLLDHQDHVLLVFPKETFTNTVNYDPVTYKPPMQGEHIYSWGNPKGVLNQYREGYVMGREEDEEKEFDVLMYTFILPIMNGDSGAAVFAEDGRIVSVITYGWDQGFAGGFSLNFTSAQVQKAEESSGKACSTGSNVPR